MLESGCWIENIRPSSLSKYSIFLRLLSSHTEKSLPCYSGWHPLSLFITDKAYTANAGEGENQLHTELDCDSDVTSESVKDGQWCRKGCRCY